VEGGDTLRKGAKTPDLVESGVGCHPVTTVPFLEGPVDFMTGRSPGLRVIAPATLPIRAVRLTCRTTWTVVSWPCSPLTVAGPRRIHTGFLVMPLGAPVTTMILCLALDPRQFLHKSI